MERPLTVIIDEKHLLNADKSRTDIGSSVLSDIFSTGAKRNLRIVLCNQALSGTDDQIMANMGYRLFTRLLNPKCLWLAQQSMRLKPAQTDKLARLEKREVVVSIPDPPYPFLVKVDELSFAPKPDESFLEKYAQEFLGQVSWTEDKGREDEPAPREAITGDALKVFLRITETAETIEDRFEALRMDRARETRARRVLEAKGYIIPEEITVGNKKIIYKVTTKGVNWIKQQKGLRIKVNRYPSGAVHEYLLNQVENKIGLIYPQFEFQRHSKIAREYSLQPDLVAIQPRGIRSIIEICIHNLNYEAANLVKERKIEGVDMVIAVTPNRRVKNALQRALETYQNSEAGPAQLAPVVVLDAGECLAPKFDWVTVFE